MAEASKESPPRIVFMGTPDFAVPSLDALVAEGCSPIAVATVPDKPAGRGRKMRASAVKKAAVEHGIGILQPESVHDPAFAEAVQALEPDVMVVVAFKILPPEVYESTRVGAFNLHASLLPAFRGAAPIQRALMAGVEETGVTTFLLRPSVDTGDILLKRSISVGPDETAGELHDRLANLGADVVVETVRGLLAGTAIPRKQEDAYASSAPKIFRDDARIDWRRPAPEVHNLIRGTSPIPGAWTEFQDGEVLKIFRSSLAEGDGAPGEILELDDRLIVACGSGAVEVRELQRQGKRRMPAADFLNGADLESGEQFDYS